MKYMLRVRVEWKGICCANKHFTLLYVGRNLKNCHISTSQPRIIVECMRFSMAIGFQVIAQSDVQERVHKLYVNQTQPGQTSASVEVEESGEYLVSVFPVREGKGIINSTTVEYGVVILAEVTTSFGE